MSGLFAVVDEFASGDHICSMHTSTERRDEVLVPYLRDGLVAGHKCVAALTDPDFSDLQARLGSRAEVDRWLASRQLQLLGVHDRVTSPETPSVTKMIEFWESAQSPIADSGGYEFVRYAAEADWWLPQVASVSQVLQFEAILNRLSARYCASTLCMYDVRSLDGALMIDLVSTHPKLIIDGVSVRNPAYLPPQPFGS
ncbi:MAG: MEDS domain-containing protein [Nocardioidaceae bacterium]